MIYYSFQQKYLPSGVSLSEEEQDESVGAERHVGMRRLGRLLFWKRVAGARCSSARTAGGELGGGWGERDGGREMGGRETKATGRGIIHLSLVFINISHLQLTSHAGGSCPCLFFLMSILT